MTFSTPPSSPLLSSTFLLDDKPQLVRQRVGSLRLAMLTMSILGVQMFWSILMAYGNPYLAGLGFSSALSSIVWLAGPLGGALVQPVVGMWSDNWSPQKSPLAKRFGRRRPFMVVGAMSTIASLLALAYVREGLEVLGTLAGMSSSTAHQVVGPDGNGNWLLKAAALLWVYVLNLAIQPLQVGVRTYVVDCVPVEQQVEASAWISRWNSFGAVIAFWLGSLDLPGIFPWAGKDQFKVLALIDAVVLMTTLPVGFRAGSGLEDLNVKLAEDQLERGGLLQIWKKLYKTWKVMPRVSWIVCKVQFWSWMAWFPCLYYETMYIASLAPPNLMSQSGKDQSAFNAASDGSSFSNSHETKTAIRADSTAQAVQAGSFASFLFALTSLVFTLLLPVLLNHVRALNISKLWLAAQAVVLVGVELTIFVNAVPEGSALFACLGFSWAMTQWAPYAMISKEVSRLEIAWEQEREMGDETNRQKMGGIGSILGLHNVAISAPQVIAALECSILFGIFDGLHVNDKVGWVLRVSSLSVIGAAWSARELL